MGAGIDTDRHLLRGQHEARGNICSTHSHDDGPSGQAMTRATARRTSSFGGLTSKRGDPSRDQISRRAVTMGLVLEQAGERRDRQRPRLRAIKCQERTSEARRVTPAADDSAR